MKKALAKILKFLKVYGIDAVISLVMWSSPTWLSLFIPSLKPFALMWLGLLVSPLIPVWIVVPLFAVIIHYLRKKIVQLIHYIKDMLNKLKMAQELLVYFSHDEFKLILGKGKEMYKIKETDTTEFKNQQDDKRDLLIKNNWEIEV